MSLSFRAAPLDGLVIVETHPHIDPRGSFTRFYGMDNFAAAGLSFVPSQISASFNPRSHTLRGMHWQAEPHGETKLVRVTRGRAFDVMFDLRPSSATRGKWFGCMLNEGDGLSLLIPPGVAHGFLTLADDTEVSYAIEGEYAPGSARGLRFDDPAFAVPWPAEPRQIAERDLAWPAWVP